MRADAESFTFLAAEGLVKIPFFQRGYVWDKNNWEELLNDLFNFEKSQFLGSLILKQQVKQTGKPKEVVVIDGQQRLTTLSILLKALYDTFPEDVKPNCYTAIHTHLFYKNNPTDSNYLIKIKHSRIDSNYYTQVIEGTIGEEEFEKIIVADINNKITSTDNKIIQCYKYFIIELKKRQLNDRIKLFSSLLDIQNKILVIIDLGENEDEQSIFDTINSAGVRLSGADIVKNSLFQKAFDLKLHEDKISELYKLYWDSNFSIDEDAINFWNEQRSTGRIMRDNVEILLHSIAVIKGFFDPDKNTLSDLSALYKKYISKFDEKELEEFLKEISEYSSLYKQKVLIFDKSSIFDYSDSMQRLFHILHICEISTFHPYILYIFNKYKKNNDKVNDELLKLEKFVIRRMITKGETKSYNKLCKDFIDNENLLELEFAKITDDEIIDGIEIISNKNAALLLFWIELCRRQQDNKQSIKGLKFNYSLEHIMPQKWEEFWHSVPVKDNKGNILIDELAKKVRNSKIYSLGNMTLLNTSLNISLRNYNFEIKINGDGRKKGIRHYASLSITNDDIIRAFDNGEKIWDEENIERRTINLGKEILQIWG